MFIQFHPEFHRSTSSVTGEVRFDMRSCHGYFTSLPWLRAYHYMLVWSANASCIFRYTSEACLGLQDISLHVWFSLRHVHPSAIYGKLADTWVLKCVECCGLRVP